MRADAKYAPASKSSSPRFYFLFYGRLNFDFTKFMDSIALTHFSLSHTHTHAHSNNETDNQFHMIPKAKGVSLNSYSKSCNIIFQFLPFNLLYLRCLVEHKSGAIRKVMFACTITMFELFIKG